MFHGISDYGNFDFIIKLSLIWKHNPPTWLKDQPLIKPKIFCRAQWGMPFSYIKTQIPQELLLCKVRFFIKDCIG